MLDAGAVVEQLRGAGELAARAAGVAGGVVHGAVRRAHGRVRRARARAAQVARRRQPRAPISVSVHTSHNISDQIFISISCTEFTAKLAYISEIIF